MEKCFLSNDFYLSDDGIDHFMNIRYNVTTKDDFQRFLDYADQNVEMAFGSRIGPYADTTSFLEMPMDLYLEYAKDNHDKLKNINNKCKFNILLVFPDGLFQKGDVTVRYEFSYFSIKGSLEVSSSRLNELFRRVRGSFERFNIYRDGNWERGSIVRISQYRAYSCTYDKTKSYSERRFQLMNASENDYGWLSLAFDGNKKIMSHPLFASRNIQGVISFSLHNIDDSILTKVLCTLIRVNGLNIYIGNTILQRQIYEFSLFYKSWDALRLDFVFQDKDMPLHRMLLTSCNRRKIYDDPIPFRRDCHTGMEFDLESCTQVPITKFIQYLRKHVSFRSHLTLGDTK